MCNISEYFIFQQDSAPAHWAKETVDLLSAETPAFILPTLWPPNSPDLNLVDYKVWSVLQEQVHKVEVDNVDELRQRMQTAWNELHQRITDKAIKQWRTYLRACVEAKGDHFEHKLWRLVQNDRLQKRFKFCNNLSGMNDFTLTYLKGCR